MGIRRKSREATLQFLFQDDFVLKQVSPGQGLEDRFADFCTLYHVSKKARPYAFSLLQGIMESCSQIDRLIEANARNWRLSRLSITDRNLLRIAVYEMVYCDDVPDQVVINEALEIAKRFGSDDSPPFINGVLDGVRASLQSGDSKSHNQNETG